MTGTNGVKLVLASASPRRRELLELAGITGFEVFPADIDEAVPEGTAPGDGARLTAERKAAEVAARRPNALVIAADTVVYVSGRVLGKPKSDAEADEMLRLLSGKTHTVFTGLALRRGSKALSLCESTDVTFRELTEAERSAYIATGEPSDKAGAYGIQGRGCVLVRGIRGDYFNVMGLPMCRLGEALAEFGVDILGR